MHNLIKENLEKLDILTRQQHSRKYHDDWYGHSGSDYHRVGDYFPSTIRERVIEKFMDKSFDQAFAYFCTLVPKYQQKEFKEGFTFGINKSWRSSNYEIVNGIIRKIEHEDYKKPVRFKSDDYTETYQHKVTGHKISDNEYWNRSAYIRTKGSSSNGKWMAINRDDYELITLTGWSQEFESTRDPRYLKLTQERAQRKHLEQKKEDKVKKHRSYCFLTKDELQKKCDISESRLVRDRHGFDKTTFMGIEYHGQKRKLKEKL